MTKESENSLWDDLDWGDLADSMSQLSDSTSETTKDAVKDSGDAPPPALTPQTPISANKTDSQKPSASTQPIVLPIHPAPAPVASPAKPLPKAEPHKVFIPGSIGRLSLTNEQGETVHIDVKDHLPVGRNSANGLVIKDRRVSGYHAKILPTADGVFEIVDLKSTGGTFVNGNSISRHTLADGDRIEFAALPAVFSYVAGASCDSTIDEGATLFTPIRSKKATAISTLHQPVYALTIKEEGAAPRRLPLSRNVSIGRHPSNGIIHPDSRISGRHAWILFWEDGWVELLDLYSTWGTQLNGQPILNAFLKPGDVIHLGPVEMLFDHWQPQGD